MLRPELRKKGNFAFHNPPSAFFPASLLPASLFGGVWRTEILIHLVFQQSNLPSGV
jgi:hypothetical protein